MYIWRMSYEGTVEAPSARRQRGASNRLGSRSVALRRLALRWSRQAEWKGWEAVETRSWRLFARTHHHDAWLIAWPIGGTIQLHDHGESSGAIVVLCGVLEETRLHVNIAGGYEPACRALAAGGVGTSFSRHEIHDVTNNGPTPALSLHVYRPRLTTMTFYELLGNELSVRSREHVSDDAPEARASASGTSPSRD
jgi:hypothetical protein